MVYEPLNQVSVQPKIDVTFAKALRSILRQDPDIIMVGEIRDIETATMTVQAALTGHLVFSKGLNLFFGHKHFFFLRS